MTCTSDSLFASNFTSQTQTTVADSTALNSALAALTTAGAAAPQIIILSSSISYQLSAAYTLGNNVCIQVCLISIYIRLLKREGQGN